MTGLEPIFPAYKAGTLPIELHQRGCETLSLGYSHVLRGQRRFRVTPGPALLLPRRRAFRRFCFQKWRGYWGSNPGRQGGNLTRYHYAIPSKWSWSRESNPAPRPYQGRVPPTELDQRKWSPRWESNPPPQVYETCALPMSYSGEWLGVQTCSQQMVENVGLEPTTLAIMAVLFQLS